MLFTVFYSLVIELGSPGCDLWMIGLLCSSFGFGYGWLVVRTLSLGTVSSEIWAGQGQQPFLLHHFIPCLFYIHGRQVRMCHVPCLANTSPQSMVSYLFVICVGVFFTWVFLYESFV